eukprot:SAG31_NODE_2919_length_4912_cov_52.769790_2_plen_167_part_00
MLSDLSMDVLELTGSFVVARNLVSRREAAALLAVNQRARALCGQALLAGTIVKFANRDGIYVGDPQGAKETDANEGYSFRFGEQDTMKTEKIRLETLAPADWLVTHPTERVTAADFTCKALEQHCAAARLSSGVSRGDSARAEPCGPQLRPTLPRAYLSVHCLRPL